MKNPFDKTIKEIPVSEGDLPYLLMSMLGVYK